MEKARLARIALAVLAFVSAAGGQAVVQVQRGWGGRERAGRWNLVKVRTSSATPRNVTLEWVAATEGGFESVIRENVAIGPAVGTFELFAPMQYSRWGRGVLVIRDAQRQRAIAQSPAHLSEISGAQTPLGPQDIFVGGSGRRPPPGRLLQYAGAQGAFEPEWLLPRASVGYDALDVLFLDQPDLRQLDVDQQRAIVEWVAGGGSLLLCPEDNPPPKDGPLIAALPCRIGELTQYTLSPQVLKSAALQPRFAQLAGRTLEPKPGAKPLVVFPGAPVTAWSGRLGLGQIVVCPMDVGSLEFEAADEAQAARSFWRPILERLVPIPPPPQSRRPFASTYNQYLSESEDQQREGAAVNALADFVAPPKTSPGIRLPGGSFALLCIFVVIGPMDWLVRRATGAQTWGWVTTAGWVGLIALGGVWVYAMISRVPPQTGIVRVIEQVDRSVVASSTFMGIESSAARYFQVDAGQNANQPGGWWEPVLPGMPNATGPAAQPDLSFQEIDQACTPERSWTSHRDARFLRSRETAPAPPIIEATLRLVTKGQGNTARLKGTIKNLSTLALKDIHLRTKLGVVTPTLGTGGVLAPGQTMPIDLPAEGGAFTPGSLESHLQSFGHYGSRSSNTAVQEQDLWSVAADLDGRRSLRIDSMFSSGQDIACIYAQFVDPPSPIHLSDETAAHAQSHQWFRAIVPLSQQSGL